MILVDTNVLVALVDPRDDLHRRAVRDLKKLLARELLAPAPVLTETCFLLPHRHHRARLSEILRRFGVRPCLLEDEAALWEEVFEWLEQYAEHEPDWADGYLIALCARDRRLKIWTYDQDFTDLWRAADGRRVPLAVRAR